MVLGPRIPFNRYHRYFLDNWATWTWPVSYVKSMVCFILTSILEKLLPPILSSRFFWDVGKRLPSYMAQHPRWQHFQGFYLYYWIYTNEKNFHTKSTVVCVL
jgi:hypothetical protein